MDRDGGVDAVAGPAQSPQRAGGRRGTMLARDNIAGLWEIGVFEIVLPRGGIDTLGAIGRLRFVVAPVEDDGDYFPETIRVIIENLIK